MPADVKTILSIKDLQTDPSNANKNTPRGRSLLETSVRKYGIGRSVLADKHGMLIAGNSTTDTIADVFDNPGVIVVQTDGTKLVVVQRTDLDMTTDIAAREMAIADNRIASVGLDWDVEILKQLEIEGADLASMWTKDELAELFEAITPEVGGATDPDDVPAKRETAIVAGDLFQCGNHRLLCGDSTSSSDVERLMAGARADAVVTSPPYAVGIDYGTYEDTIENLRAMLPVLAEIWLEHIVRPGGFAVINFSDIASGRDAAGVDDVCEYPMAVEYWPIFRGAGWYLWSRRVWCKPNARVHSPWAIQSNRAASDWEHVWTWKAPGDVIVKRVNQPVQSANGWFDTTSEHGVDIGKEIHGAGMAVALPMRLISLHTVGAGSIVAEPFTGTGTTMIAAEQLGRRCFGMEIEPSFVQVAIDRWEAFTGQQAVKLEAEPSTADTAK